MVALPIESYISWWRVWEKCNTTLGEFLETSWENLQTKLKNIFVLLELVIVDQYLIRT